MSNFREQAIQEAISRYKNKPKLPTPTALQAEILASQARYKVLNCGRRFGKSTIALNTLVEQAQKARRGVFYWIWPNYGMAYQAGWRMLTEAVPTWELSETKLRAIAPNGAEIWLKSADNPDSLRGVGINGVVIDECRDIESRVWTEIVRPSLADKRGWAIFASTPRGIDWFYSLYQQGIDKPDWECWTRTTYDNPYIASDEIDAMQAEMPERLFRQEVLAEFMNDAGGVFRGIAEVATLLNPDNPEQHRNHSTVMGVDWGKQNDYSVFTVICRDCNKVVDWLRFNKIDYIYQRQQLEILYKKWRVENILAEANSIGLPNIEMLWQSGLPVMAFNTTATSKPKIINGLVLAIEQKQILIPKEYLGELQAYEMKRNANTGHPTYSAPNGMNDDRVISLALAVEANKLGSGLGLGIM